MFTTKTIRMEPCQLCLHFNMNYVLNAFSCALYKCGRRAESNCASDYVHEVGGFSSPASAYSPSYSTHSYSSPYKNVEKHIGDPARIQYSWIQGPKGFSPGSNVFYFQSLDQLRNLSFEALEHGKSSQEMCRTQSRFQNWRLNITRQRAWKSLKLTFAKKYQS